MKNSTKNIITIFFMVVASITFSNIFNNKISNNEIDFSQFVKQVENKQVTSAQIKGNKIYGKKANGEKYSTTIPKNYNEIINDMVKSNISIKVMPDRTFVDILIAIFISWFPFFIIAGIWLYLVKSIGKGGSSGLPFAKSKAKMYMSKDTKTSFDDIAGIEEAKAELEEIVHFLKNPEEFIKIGAKIPRGCLLLGNPGTGKTLLAKAIAGEAQVPFFSISGSSFVEMFVGVGAGRVRDLFEQAKKHSPSIIFIDEIDAVGRHRGSGVGGGNDEREQTLNQLLVEMDGFEETTNVIVLAATNRVDVLDKALLRPGRFDRQIVIPNPDVKGREQILNVHSNKIKIAANVDLNIIARGTPGFSGAELANVVNEAALYAAKNNKKIVTMTDFEYAKDKVMMGVERKSMAMKESEKKLTAYHEAGHALVSLHCPASDPIHKATIIPRGQALGMVMRLPTDDNYSMTREKILSDLAVAMGGRASEEIIFGYDKITTGASSDIQYVTKVTKSLVKKWGLSDKVGLINLEVEEGDFISQEQANMVDQEIKSFSDKAYEKAKQILNDNMDDLHLLAKALIEHETLSGDEINILLKNRKLDKNTNEDNNSKDKRTSSFS